MKQIVVDTSVWSLRFRRKKFIQHPAINVLEQEIRQNSKIILLGIILQELLQGVNGERDYIRLRHIFANFFQSINTIDEHIFAAEIVNSCRQKGIQISTIDSLVAATALKRDHFLLTTDKDFLHIAKHFPLKLI